MCISPLLLHALKVNQSETVSVCCVHWNTQMYPAQNHGMPSADNIASHENSEAGLISDTQKVIKMESTCPNCILVQTFSL